VSSEEAIWRVALDVWRAQRGGEDAINTRRAQRLAKLVAHARSRSEFYRRLCARLPNDSVALTSLPPVSKYQLMAAFDDWIADPVVDRAVVDDILASATEKRVAYRDGLFVCTSSGTTARPGIFVHDQSAVDVYRVLNAMRLTLGWLGSRDWLRLGRRGIRWAAPCSASDRTALNEVVHSSRTRLEAIDAASAVKRYLLSADPLSEPSPTPEQQH